MSILLRSQKQERLPFFAIYHNGGQGKQGQKKFLLLNFVDAKPPASTPKNLSASGCPNLSIFPSTVDTVDMLHDRKMAWCTPIYRVPTLCARRCVKVEPKWNQPNMTAKYNNEPRKPDENAKRSAKAVPPPHRSIRRHYYNSTFQCVTKTRTPQLPG